MRAVLALCLMFIVGAVAVAQPAPRLPHIYAVLFSVTTDALGRPVGLKVERVIDPLTTGTSEAVDLPVPDVFVAAAFEQMRDKSYKPDDRFFTYQFYDPARPDRADIDPRNPTR